MKKALLIIIAGVLIGPAAAYATTAVPWVISSLTDKFITPTNVNGNPVAIHVTSTATSTFAGPISMQNWNLATSTVVCMYPENCQYQATGTNDMNTIIAAATAANASGGGTVLIKRGVYNANGSKTLPANVCLVGEGMGTVLRMTNTSYTHFLTLSDNDCVRNLEIDGSLRADGLGRANTFFIHNGHTNIWIQNVYNYRTDVVVLLVHDLVATTTNITVSDNHLYNSKLGTVEDTHGGFMDNIDFANNLINFDENYAFGEMFDYNVSQNVTLIGNQFYATGFARFTDEAIDMSGEQDNAKFIGNTVVGNFQRGIKVGSNSKDVVVADNYFEYKTWTPTGSDPSPVTLQDGISLWANGHTGAQPTGVKVANNTVVAAPITLSGVLYASVIGNTIRDYTGSCLLLQRDTYLSSDSPTEFNSITGNTLKDCGVGIDLVDTTYNTITANTIISTTTSMTYGIREHDGADYNTISNNTVTGATIENISPDGTNTVYVANPGFDENLLLATSTLGNGINKGVLQIKGDTSQPTMSLLGFSNGRFTMQTNSGSNRLLQFNNTSDPQRLDVNLTDGRLGIGDSSPDFALEIATTTETSSGGYFGISAVTDGDIFVVLPNGNTGIATTSPGTLLSIGTTGGINFTTGTSTFSTTGGINLKSGCYAINGTCITAAGLGAVTALGSGFSTTTGSTITFATTTTAFNGLTIGGQIIPAAGTLTFTPTITGTLTVAGGGTGAGTLTGLLQGNGTSPITGVTGTAGQFPYYNGSNTLLATSTIFLATSGNVGIGTTSPQRLFEISSGTSGVSVLRLSNTNGVIAANDLLGALEFFGGDSSNGGTFGASGVRAKITGITEDISGQTGLALYTAGSLGGSYTTDASVERMRITNTGKVGIGTTTPNWLLQVNGTRPSIALSDSSAGANLKHWLLSSMGGNLYIGTSSDLYATSSPAAITVTNAGLFGLGTSSPWRTLDVNGTVGMKGLTGSAGLQVGILCLSASNEVINESVACVASAARYKKDIHDLDVGLDEVMKLRPVSFYWKPDYNGALQSNPNFSGLQYSLVADEVQRIDPHLVSLTTATTTFEGKTYAPGTVEGLADTNHWVALFVNAIQQQQKEIEALGGGVKKTVRSVEENWQWIAIGMLILWNMYLTFRRRV